MEPKPHQKSAEEHRRFLEEETVLRKNSEDLSEKMPRGLNADNFNKDENKKEAEKQKREEEKKAKEGAEKNKEQSEKDKKLSERVREASNLEELYKIIRGIGEIKSMDGEIAFTPEELIKQMDGARAKMKAMTTEEFKEELASEVGAIKFVTRRFEIRGKFVGFVMDEKISDKNTERNEKRDNFAKEEYKTNNVVSKIQRFLGIKYDSKKVDSVDSNYNDYKIANTELLDLKLERLKRSGLDGEEMKKEMGNLVKEFDIDEKINVYAAHTSARTKVIEEKVGKKPGWILEKFEKAVNGYRKMPLKKKMLISAALFVGGGGIATAAGFVGISSVSLGFLGGKILTGAFGTTVLGIVRGLGSASAGTGVAAALEARKINKDKKKSTEFNEEILKNAENEADKFTFVMKKLSALDYKESLKIEKKSANIRRAAGVITAAGMFFLPKLIMEKMGFGGHVGQHAATGEPVQTGTKGLGEIRVADEQMTGFKKEDIIPVPKVGVVPEDIVSPKASMAPEDVISSDARGTEAEEFVKWSRGGGFNNHANVPAGTEDLQGGAEAATAESMRDRVGPNAWDAMDQSVGHETGATLHETVQTSHGSFPPPERATSLHETVQSQEKIIQPEATEMTKEVVNPRVRVIPDEVAGPKVRVVPDNVVNPRVRVIPDEVAGTKVRVVPDNVVQPKVEVVPSFDKVRGSFFGHKMDEFLNGAERELLNAERGYGGDYGPAMSPTPGPGVDSAWFENTKFSKDFLEDFGSKIFEGDKLGATKVFREKISEAAFGGKSHWDSLKDLTFGEAKEQLKNDKLGSLFRNMQKILGDNIKPLQDETMAKWTLRVSKIAVEQTNIKY